MSATEIMLERDTANDESALVVAVHVANGTAVDNETLLFEIENSKAVQEVYSTSAGIVSHHLVVGEDVQFGAPIARILTPEQWADELSGVAPAPDSAKAVKVPSPAPADTLVAPSENSGQIAMNGRHGTSVGPAYVSEGIPSSGERLKAPRFSPAAEALIAKHHLGSVDFASDFVTTKIVHRHLHPAATQTTPKPTIVRPAEPAGDVHTDKSGREVERRKRVEIEMLSQGAGNTMLSVLGIVLGPMTVSRSADDFLHGSITDLVIYEASRLMRKYPNLNASYSDGRIVSHDDVHAGLAIDNGGRLVVYGIEHSDRASMSELSESISDAVERYMSGSLTSAELTRATFTVTDLSGSELDFVLPLLPRGQSCILGITRSARTGFSIFAGFDHRVTEGKELGSFLGELRDRLVSFTTAQPKTVKEICCGFCGRSADEAFQKSKNLGLLKLVNRDGHEHLCCASCWNGW